MILQLTLITMYLLVLGVTSPSFWRLIRNRPKTFDAVKACCALLAASIVNGFFFNDDKAGLGLFDITDTWRTVSSFITCVIFVTLIVVVLKTERAMRSAIS